MAFSSFSLDKFYVLNCVPSENKRVEDKYSYMRNVLGKRQTEDFTIKTKNDFKTSLNKVKEEASTGLIPLIHIDCHGDTTGLKLESKARINWNELINHLTEINILTRNNLWVCLAVCDAAHIMKIVQDGVVPPKRAPFYGCVAPTQKIGGDELNKFELFYKELIQSQISGNPSSIRPQNEDLFGTKDFLIYYSSYFLRFRLNQILEHEIKPLNTDSIIREKTLDSIANEISLSQSQKIDKEKIKQLVARDMSDGKVILKSFKELESYYLMLDLFPEQATRFPLISGIKDWKIETYT